MNNINKKKLKILFVGESSSLHVARWINQLSDTDWDIRLFDAKSVVYKPNTELKIGTLYLAYPPYVECKNPMVFTLFKNRYSLKGLIYRITQRLSHFINFNERQHALSLAKLIQNWEPDIIHLLGINVGWRSNGNVILTAHHFLHDKLSCPLIISTWGADLDLYPALGKKQHREITSVLSIADGLVVEGDRDLALAQQLGFHGRVLDKLTGFGGITWDPKDFCQPSKISARNIIFLKGRDNSDDIKDGGDPQGRAMTAIKAFDLCQDLLKPFSIVIVQATPFVEIQAKKLAEKSKLDIKIYSNSIKIPHNQILKLLGSSRIMIAITASDGLPSTLIEAMSLGAFPIHSGLETVSEWIKDGENGLLVPPENVQAVANALRIALTDDDFVDLAANRNIKLIENNLSDKVIRPRVIRMYESLKQY